MLKMKPEEREIQGFDDWILVAFLLNNLDSKYKEFVHRLVTQLDDIPNSDKTVTLLHQEDRLQKRDLKEQAMAAAMKKFNKSQEEKKHASYNESSRGGRASGRGRGNNSNTRQFWSSYRQESQQQQLQRGRGRSRIYQGAQCRLMA